MARTGDHRPDGGTRTGGDPSDPSADLAAERAGHDLLVAMAGRLPDRLLWRLRDWLAAGAHVALRTALPRTLLRHRVGVTETERALLREAVVAWGGPARLVDAVLHADTAPEPTVAFADDALGWDAPDLVLRALVPAVGEVGELRRAWRVERPARRAVTPPPTRVVLVSAGHGLPSLAGAIARALRAQGDPAPQVEVVGPGTPLTGYHRDALAASEVLWRPGVPPSLPVPTAGADAPDPRRATSFATELVGHG